MSSIEEPGWLKCGNSNQINNCKGVSNDPGSAIDFCKEVEEKATNIFDAAIALGNPLAKIIEAISSNSKSAQSIKQKLGINIDVKTIAKQMNKCDNLIGNNQSNIIRGPGVECIKAWKELGISIDEIKKAGELSGITQGNVQTTIVNCKSNAVLDALSKMDANIDNQAVVEAINKAKGLLSKSESDQKICNDIETNLSACKYVQQNNCCTNYVQNNQLNLIDKGCTLGKWSDLSQTNDSSIYAKCTLSAESSISDDISTEIFNKLKLSSENSSEGLTMAFLIVIMIILGLIIGSPIILAKSLGNKLFSIIGVVLLIIGGICITMYFTTQKKIIKRNNNPLSTCDKTKLFKQPSRIKYGEINKYMTDNDNIIGYDFYPDNINIDLNKIPVNQTGLIAYITQIDRDNLNCDELIDTSKEICITYIKSSSDIKLIMIGSVLLIAGVVQILIGIFKKQINK